MKFTPNENILRVALIVFSILFGILSVSLIALGVVYIDELWWPKRYVGLDFIELPTLLIVLGSLSLALAMAGCFCAKTYNRMLLVTFAIVLFAILCLELSIAVIAFINFDEHEGGHTQTHHEMFKQYSSNDEDTRLFFQELEDHYDCCGVTGAEENCTVNYTKNLDFQYLNNETTENPANTNLLPTKGCAEAVNDQIQLVATEIGYFTTILAVLQIIEIGYIILIQRSIKDYYTA